MTPPRSTVGPLRWLSVVVLLRASAASWAFAVVAESNGGRTLGPSEVALLLRVGTVVP